MTIKIPGISDALQKRLDNCAKDVAVALDLYFPEFRSSYGDKYFDERLLMTIYFELIHAGFFK